MAAEWSDERAAELARLWDAGGSAATIASQLGISKNAVLGKIHRLRISGYPIRRPVLTRAEISAASLAAKLGKRIERERREAQRLARNPPKFYIAGGGAVIERAKPHQSPYAEVQIGTWEPLPDTTPLRLADLKPLSCRWPVELSGANEHHFCGAIKVNGPYCPHHESIGVAKDQPRPRSVDYIVKRFAA